MAAPWLKTVLDRARSAAGALTAPDMPLDRSARGGAAPQGAKLSLSGWWKERTSQRRGNKLPASRSYRYLARQIASERPYAEGGRTILVSSLVPLELSNETLLMFAYFMRDELGCSILLVDGTFREGGIGARLGHNGAPGFLDLVYGNERWAGELVRPTQRRGIFALPVGRPPPLPVLPIQEENIATLFREVRRSFDYVLVQQTSILDDTRYLRCAGDADLILLLIDEGVTSSEELERCKKVFRDYQIANVRLVLSTPG
jgi:Mrp family chromosome partitioning ATPase